MIEFVNCELERISSMATELAVGSEEEVLGLSSEIDGLGITALRLHPKNKQFSALSLYRPLLSELTRWAASLSGKDGKRFARVISASGSFGVDPPELPFPFQSASVIELFVPTGFLNAMKSLLSNQLRAFGEFSLVSSAWSPGHGNLSPELEDVARGLTVSYSPAAVNCVVEGLLKNKRSILVDARVRRFVGANIRLFPPDEIFSPHPVLTDDLVWAAFLVNNLGWPEFHSNVSDTLELKHPITQKRIQLDATVRDEKLPGGQVSYFYELQSYKRQVEKKWPLINATLGLE